MIVSSTDNINLKQDEKDAMDIDIPVTPKRKVSIDRPTEPTYPWRKPSIAEEVDNFKHITFNYYFSEKNVITNIHDCFKQDTAPTNVNKLANKTSEPEPTKEVPKNKVAYCKNHNNEIVMPKE